MRKLLAISLLFISGFVAIADVTINENADIILAEGEIIHFEKRKTGQSNEDIFEFLVRYEKRIYLCFVTQEAMEIDIICFDSTQ